MDRQTLRDWVIRYNAEGVGGLSDRTSPGPKPRLTPEQEAAVAELVRRGTRCCISAPSAAPGVVTASASICARGELGGGSAPLTGQRGEYT